MEKLYEMKCRKTEWALKIPSVQFMIIFWKKIQNNLKNHFQNNKKNLEIYFKTLTNHGIVMNFVSWEKWEPWT